MKFLDGYKSYIGAGLGVVVGILQGLGFLSPELATTGYTVATGIFGAGMAGKMQKVGDALAEAVKKD